MAASKNPVIRLRHILDEAEGMDAAIRDLEFSASRG
jgi:hypothetical protein